MNNTTVVFDVLEGISQTIESHPGPQWIEFSHRAGDLAEQFKAIVDEDDPQAATDDLKVAVGSLLQVCKDHKYVARLLKQVEETSSEHMLSSPGSKRPPSPANEPKFNPQEIANRYYSLLVQLREAAGLPKEDTNDR